MLLEEGVGGYLQTVLHVPNGPFLWLLFVCGLFLEFNLLVLFLACFCVCLFLEFLVGGGGGGGGGIDSKPLYGYIDLVLFLFIFFEGGGN